MDSDTEDRMSKLPKKEKHKKSKKKKDVPPQTDQIEVDVEVVHEHPNKTPPVVGYFPSGFDPLKDHGGAPDFQVYRHRNLPKRMQLVVSPAGSAVEFVGTSYAGEATAGHRAMYAIGVLDKEAQTLKIVPIAGNKIFRLEPKVKGMGAADSEPAHSTLEEMTPQQKLAETTAIWGTKRDMEKVSSDSYLTLLLVVLSSATEPEFKVKSLKGDGLWEYVNIKSLNLFTPFALGKLGREGGQWEIGWGAKLYFLCLQDESEKRKLSCMFSYINHLIKFKDQFSFNASSAKTHKIPNILRHKFSTMFAVSESKRLPPEKISLLICYVLVLTLFSDEFRTDYTDIAKDLSMSAMSVRQLYEQLGCKISRQSNCFFATLPVPLKFPDLRLRKRKR
ncbi:uncharacterized protein LOC109803772 [Cajanus cajan]|uniref:uncharacterized protein LOC109803772 n=1 Tax=Cajanus cajan TaxID=3821 RepID=UPI0010FAF884|nr:uncharacterized protein LOC109803772 [Cajanus cajan]